MNGKLAGPTTCLGRVLLSSIFLASAVEKVRQWEGTIGGMQEHDVPAAPILLVIAFALEALGGLCVLLGCGTRIGAIALIVFLIPVTYYFHDFWTLEGAERQQQMMHFMKNVAILGGLFVVAGQGGGVCSLDHRRWKKRRDGERGGSVAKRAAERPDDKVG